MVETPLVECVPNFSEGRRRDVIETIVSAISSAGVNVLDVHSDVDHNRSVVTFIGTPDAAAEAAIHGVKTASGLIDLHHHQGVHPRIGAADVVPFVPLRHISMADCVALAHAVGRRVADEIDLPVYFYGLAALTPERHNLAAIRRGGFETLKQVIASDPYRAPDFGPKQLGSAGAVAIGARAPLIAFNAYLNTDEVQIARNIARVIRTSNGGLPYLKAMGVLVGGRAQVSMNVIDFRQTSLFTILEAVRVEARRYDVDVVETELVGLIPQRALLDAALQYLQLPLNVHEKILEQHIGDVTGNYQEVVFE
ncbi:MAG: glutamate formimidoyltransferase [Chloroflexi bacterium]|nr:MAG: glutamate formimidoyltransferase [Phototrophicales bacterium]RMF79624.1 MAG: glutamate formimidoyltransferase [Chloroflexota bacterium]